MSSKQNKKDSLREEENINKISEENEDFFTESEKRQEAENNQKHKDAQSAMEDSFSESFYKEILEDSEKEEEKAILQKSVNNPAKEKKSNK